MWSRNGTDLTSQFPEIVKAATEQLPEGAVLDGELVVYIDGRLSFDALQRRNNASPATIRALVAKMPASYVTFDLLTIGGVDLRPLRWSIRHARLEGLAAWRPPLQLCPSTADIEVAREWFDVLPDSMGIEGLVCKGASSRYVGGTRSWLKWQSVGVVGCSVGHVAGVVPDQRDARRGFAVFDGCRGQTAA